MKLGICDYPMVTPRHSGGAAIVESCPSGGRRQVPLPVVPKARFQRDAGRG